MNLYHLLDQSATRCPDRPAVFQGTTPVSTYAQLRRRALSLAAALRRDFGKGDRIAILSENRPEYVELLFGIWAAEMAAVPINAKLHAREVVQLLEDSGAAAIFVSPKLQEGIDAALDGSPANSARRIAIAGPQYAAMIAEEPFAGRVESDPAALAWLFYTSGTTGRSKGAMLSHRNLMAMTLAHLADIEVIDADCSLLHPAPMSHGSGLYILPYVARAARQVVPVSGGFQPIEFMDLCDAHPSCGVFLAPTMVQRLRLDAEKTGRRPKNLRAVIYGGGPMYLEEIRKSIDVFGQVFVQIYGQGESPMTITGMRQADYPDADDAQLASVGYPRTGIEVAVVTPEGEALATGEIGEVVCRGDSVMSGYWNNPKATADALRDGWLFTGDMGSFDERGYLTLRDRSKDVIITGGSNVYPREVEEVLLKHPAVEEVCVVGQKHDEWGEVVVAVIVPREGAKPEAGELDTHCNDHIARFKRPKRYLFADSLPKNNYGKVLKRELRQTLPPVNE
jgi:acyl-CoA synthetase (AMP-forming)/AMP-acid ligase II